MHMHIPEKETKDTLQTLSSFIKWIYIAICTGIFGGVVGICFTRALTLPPSFALNIPGFYGCCLWQALLLWASTT